MAKAKATTKYRPVLPDYLITHILSLANKDVQSGSTNYNSVELIGILAPFKAKIDSLSITAAYTTSPKETIEEKLGMDATPAPTSAYMLDGTYYTTKELYWQACYYKAVKSPQSVTLWEVKMANEYRYLNGLMSPEEISRFEAGEFVAIPPSSTIQKTQE